MSGDAHLLTPLILLRSDRIDASAKSWSSSPKSLNPKLPALLPVLFSASSASSSTEIRRSPPALPMLTSSNPVSSKPLSSSFPPLGSPDSLPSRDGTSPNAVAGGEERGSETRVLGGDMSVG